MAPHADQCRLPCRYDTQSGNQRSLGRCFPYEHLHLHCPRSPHFGERPAKCTKDGHGKLLPATMLIGFGAFNLVEGVIDHQILGIHHVNEIVPRAQWIYFEVAFLIWGAFMLLGGWIWLRRSRAADKERRQAT